MRADSVAGRARFAVAALALEALLGYPYALHRRAPHPVTWLGALIGTLERHLNQAARPAPARRLGGIATVTAVAGTAALAGLLAERLPRPLPLLAATLGLAQRSLYDHVAAVLRALQGDDLPAARRAVGMIVGRDTAALDASGVSAAALESLAESVCDGVVAPAFWLAVGGLPALFAYKAVNTADSLVGHREPRWRAFGWASARLDDALNLLPARLSGALIAVAGGRGWRVMLRDAGRHASPNAGWPEAAMAGALGVQLAGAVRTYDGHAAVSPPLGEGSVPGVADLQRGLRLYVVACGLLWVTLAVGGRAWRR